MSVSSRGVALRDPAHFQTMRNRQRLRPASATVYAANAKYWSYLSFPGTLG